MTNRFAAITIAVTLSLTVWTAVAWLVISDSRQTCEQVASSTTCAWELR